MRWSSVVQDDFVPTQNVSDGDDKRISGATKISRRDWA
jgi:hypothetical protein